LKIEKLLLAELFGRTCEAVVSVNLGVFSVIVPHRDMLISDLAYLLINRFFSNVISLNRFDH